ncbi:hypothetical protein [Cytobacillus sp. IB215665]|uniref:hypothetical protein n=1 Tax=Cytobacillus sp. IB215665 TaxID=3097357 RepID=UPI002A16ED03|nr:hypothetical protein [Cytobacillus sp. IB215665]MDX8367831.1 hypothetical protein [Cytobacillus sp. IB215665]
MENKQRLDEIMGVAVNSAKDQGVGVTDKVNLNLDDFMFLHGLAEKVDKSVLLPKEIANAINVMDQNEMTCFAIICSLQEESWLENRGCEIEEVIKAHKILRKWSFGDSGGNTDRLIEALANGYIEN